MKILLLCKSQRNKGRELLLFCGEDLTDTILQHKSKRIPVNLNSTSPEDKEEIEKIAYFLKKLL